MKILITGASGFVGNKTCTYLSNIGYEIFAFSRADCQLPAKITIIRGESISKKFSTKKSLEGIDCIIHLAGRTSIENKKNCSYYEYFKDNVEETLKLAKVSAKANVKRFIFISSIKVNGESTNNRDPFIESDIPNPKDNYALSKHQAELGLQEISKKTNLEIVIVRPPLIYSEDAKGYFGIILKIIEKNIPLPFGCFIHNRRSIIYLENFLNFLVTLIHHPKAANNIFLCSDRNDLSTYNLLKNLYFGMHNKNYIYKIPIFILKAFFYLIGKGILFKKLSESLIIDSSKSFRILNWNPPIDTFSALRKVANNYYSKDKFL